MRAALLLLLSFSLLTQAAPAARAQDAAKLIQPSSRPAETAAASPKSDPPAAPAKSDSSTPQPKSDAPAVSPESEAPVATPASEASHASPASGASAAAGPAALTNDGVIALVDAGLDWQLIVEKIKAAPAKKFDTSPDALAQLRGAGANAAVIAAMLAPRDGAQSAADSEAGANAEMSKADQAPLPASVKVPAGLHVDLEMAHTIDSLTTRTGDLVSLRVVNPVVVDGVTVIAMGATATAKVVKAQRNGHWGRAGRITWELKEVTAVDGSRVPLSAAGHIVGDSHGAKVATQTALLAVGLGFAAPAALLTGFKRGENAVVPEGKRFDGFTAAEATVNPSARR